MVTIEEIHNKLLYPFKNYFNVNNKLIININNQQRIVIDENFTVYLEELFANQWKELYNIESDIDNYINIVNNELLEIDLITIN